MLGKALLMQAFFYLMTPSLVSAQALDSSAKSLTDTTKQDSTIKPNQQLETVSIQAVRANRLMPVTVTNVSQIIIEHGYLGQEMPVILSRLPSITWYSDAGSFMGYSYMRMRGSDQTRINFTLNGVPLNEPEDQGAYFSNYPDFLNSIKSIQVQRGVGTSTNGTAAFAGSVNFESASLLDTAGVELQANYGSYNTYRVSPEFRTGLLKNNLAFYGRYSITGSDGFRAHSGTKGQSFFMSAGYFGKHGVLKLTGFFGTSKSQMAYLAEPDSLLKIDYRTNSLLKDEKDDFLQGLGMAQYTMQLGYYSTITASAYYNHLSGGYDIFFAPDMYNYAVKSDFYGGIVNYQYQPRGWKVNAGVHANNYYRQHYASIEPILSDKLYSNIGNKKEFSAFVKVSYEVRHFAFFADMQYRYCQFSYRPDEAVQLQFDKIAWHFFNPKGGVSYTIKNRQVIYLSVGKTSREPTRNDMFAGYDNIDSLNYSEVGDFAKVKPEQVIDAELGTRLFFKYFTLDANLYYMHFANEIAAIGQLSYIGLPLRKNVAASFRTGLELYATITPIANLEFVTVANVSENRIKRYADDATGQAYYNVAPLLTPRFVFNQAVKYLFLKRFDIEVSCRYQTKSFLDNTDNSSLIVPASFVLNASASARFYKQCTIGFALNNIVGSRYYTAGYVQGGQPYYFAMATRNYAVILKLKF